MAGAELRVARMISVILHPVATVLLLVATVAARSSGRESLRIVLLTVGVVLAPITALIAFQARTGRWQNADASIPRERHVLFAVSLGFVLALAVIVRISTPGSVLVRGALAVCGLIAVAWALLPWVKLSLHMTFAAFTATVLAFISWPLGVAVFVLLPLLAWARLRMKRHSVAEVVVGAVAGVTAGLLLMLM
jgi:hypothetical protein